MQTLVYYDQYQKEDYEKLKASNPNIIGILSEEMLRKNYARLEVPILIIFSQPSLKLMHAFSKYEWTKAVVHIGIRHTDTLKCAHLTFENHTQLEQHYERCRLDQNVNIKKRYFESIDLDDPLDVAFIKSIYPEGIFKRKAKKQLKKSRFVKTGIITIVGNSELAKVFSKALSRAIDGRVLIVDGDFLKPSMAMHFSINKIQTAVESHLTGLDNTGINIALDALSKGVSLESFMDDVILKVNPNLHVLLGNYNIYNYEHYEMHQLNHLLSQLKNLYDIVVVSVSENIYDQMTMVSIHQGQIVIMAPDKNSVALRYVYQILPLLKHKQGITDRKLTVLTFENRNSYKFISTTAIKTLFPNHYIGPFSNRKNDMRRLLSKVQERMI